MSRHNAWYRCEALRADGAPHRDGGKDNDRDVLEGGADADVVVARKGDRVIGDHETGAKGGPDLVVDGDMQDRMEEAVRGR